MKITESQLRSIIKQELKKVLNENLDQIEAITQEISNLYSAKKPYGHKINQLNSLLAGKTITFKLSMQGEYGKARFEKILNVERKINGIFVYIKLQKPLQHDDGRGGELMTVENPTDEQLKTTTNSIVEVE